MNTGIGFTSHSGNPSRKYLRDSSRLLRGRS